MKRSGLWGPGLVGLSYESLPWFTGAAVLSAGAPSLSVVIIALLYGIGAHGIMTLNDFKALEGDRQMGVNSLPVTMGPAKAARLACWVMVLPQVVVIALLLFWDRPIHAAAIAVVLLLQLWAMRVLLTDPKGRAPWYNGTGVTLYVGGMMIAAFAIRTLEIAP
jgi:chlorophyll synthase